MGRPLCALLTATLITILPWPAHAQAAAPSRAPLVVAGVVLDPSGAAVPAAEVTVTDVSGGRVVTLADALGRFALDAPGRAPFVVTVVMKGFAPAVEAGVDGVHDLTVTLSPAVVEERVEVVSSMRSASATSTATRTSTPLLQVPQTINIVPASLLREQAALSMADAIRNVAGVNANLGEGRRDQFLIRGFSAQNDTLLDGTRDDAPYYRDVATVERIEVLKGPAAALFGRGSSGGVINRVLKAPRVDQPIADASLAIGSLGTKRFTGDVGATNGGSLSFRAAAAAEDSTSFRDEYFLRRVTIAPSVLWNGGSTTVLAQLEVLDDHRVPDRGIPSVAGRAADVRRGQTYGFAAEDFVDTSVISGSVRLERRQANGWLLRQVVRLGSYDTSFSNTAPSGATLTAGAWRVSRQQYNAEQAQQNLFSQSEVLASTRFAGVDHLLLAGLEFGEQRRSTIRFNGSAAAVDLVDPVLTRPIYSSIAATYNQFGGTTLALYTQDQLSLGTRWKALVGVRGDRYAQVLDDRRPDDVDLARTDVNWSPRAGVVFQPSRATAIYSTVSRSFQPSGEGLSLAVNAAELKPEASRNLEAGAKADLFGQRASATLSVFQLDRTNIKTTDPIDPTRLVLVGHQRTVGAEIAFEGRLSARLRAQAGYALLDAAILRSNTVTSGVNVEGNRPGLVPRHSGHLWLHYLLTSRLSLAGGVTASGLRYTANDNLVQLPGFTRTDAALTYRARRVELALNVRNLLDAKYQETATSNFQIFPGTPRDILLTVRVAR
ncbi:MAG TPA: TonB-dependent siderophore receptor [Vicinamibacterales bacterium]|nr:TonB-dependent siderophore receptor [Vicinamibacterales bacterium]